MIRRDLLSPGQQPCWLLISQVDHAHLAGQLAEHWGEPPFERLQPGDQVLEAIYHHDDGWSEWERHPEVGSDGKPLAFNEMPVASSLAIWRKSIEAAQSLGPLQGFLVAEHFCALLERFDSWRKGRPSDRQAAESFLREYHAKAAGWVQEWQVNESLGSDELARRGLAHLQMFDAISLWLCCATREAPEGFATPGGPVVTFAPLGPDRIRVSPWPFRVDPLALEISGRAIPAAHYAGGEAVAAAAGEHCTLSWRLVR